MAVLKQIWLFEIIGGMLLMCQNTAMWVYGAWIKWYCVLCSKHITPCTVVITSLLVHDKPLGAESTETDYVKLWPNTDHTSLGAILHDDRIGGVLKYLTPIAEDTTLNPNPSFRKRKKSSTRLWLPIYIGYHVTPNKPIHTFVIIQSVNKHTIHQMTCLNQCP